MWMAIQYELISIPLVVTILIVVSLEIKHGSTMSAIHIHLR